MSPDLKDYVATTYGDLLTQLKTRHIKYDRDATHFGNELDRYANEEITIQFVPDRGEEFVQIFPLLHPNDLYDLNYLVAMLAPDICNVSIRDYLATFVNIRERVYAMFRSGYYACYRDAYRLFESCRNEALLKQG